MHELALAVNDFPVDENGGKGVRSRLGVAEEGSAVTADGAEDVHESKVAEEEVAVLRMVRGVGDGERSHHVAEK